MNLEKINSYIHLAQKGRMIEIGKTAVEILLRRKRAALVIIASDASNNLKSQIETQCLSRNVPIYVFGNKKDLGKLCGRDSVATLAISDKNLAMGLKSVLS